MVIKTPLLCLWFTGEYIDAHNLRLSQFERDNRVTKHNGADQFDLFLFYAGSKAANFHNEVWKSYRAIGTQKSCWFCNKEDWGVKKCFVGKNKSVFTLAASKSESIVERLSKLVTASSTFCILTATFVDQPVRDLLCQGVFPDTTKRAVCREKTQIKATFLTRSGYSSGSRRNRPTNNFFNSRNCSGSFYE